MASGSSGRTGSGLKGFDFGSDDILCSYDDMGNQVTPNGKLTDPAVGSNSAKDFHESRKGKSSLLPVYNPLEESLRQDMISTVEKTMKKYADNLLRFLEGISGRLAQLEVYCYNLERSVGEMRTDLVRDHSEADAKLKSLENHLQEVHRSVQVLRDKQELAEAQKELAKLHLVQRESSASHSKHNVEGSSSAASDPRKTDATPDMQNLQLALALPPQVNMAPSLHTRPLEQLQPLPPPSQIPQQNAHVQSQQQTYYSPQNQMPNPVALAQHSQDQYLHTDTPYQRQQMPDVTRQTPQQTQPQVNQSQQPQPFPQYQQQWSPQLPQQVQQPQQPSTQPPIRPPTSMYPPYPPTQPANPSPETFPGSMPMQPSFSGIPPSGGSHAEASGYGYGRTSRTVPQQPVQQQPLPQHNLQHQPQPQTSQSSFGAHLSAGYPGPGTPPTQSPGPGSGYMMYVGEGGRAQQPPPAQFPQGSYPSTQVPLPPIQNPQQAIGSNLLVRHPSPSQIIRGHPYSEQIEKAVSMGYGREHVASVIQRMEETGQPVDLNAVLDRLNMHSSGGSQRRWN